MEKLVRYTLKKTTVGLVSAAIAGSAIMMGPLQAVAEDNTAEEESITVTTSLDDHDNIYTFDVRTWEANTISEIKAEIDRQLAEEVTEDKDLDYVIQWGDTVWGITNAFEIDQDRFVKVNGIENPDLIYAGDTVSLDVTQDVQMKVQADESNVEEPASETAVKSDVTNNNENITDSTTKGSVEVSVKAPVKAPETEAPETEAPVEPEAPKTEAPVEPEAPKTEAPVEPEAPKTEAPVEPEAPKTEAPVEPEAPKTEAPVEPEAPKTEAPVEPEAPETETPEEPEAPETETPEEPEVPETETPVEPEVPETETPVEPEVPETEAPVEPEAPETETPEEPEVPETETPEEPEVPETETPEEPEVPETETPEEPKVPETPEEPKVPETPEEPKVPETPEEPVITTEEKGRIIDIPYNTIEKEDSELEKGKRVIDAYGKYGETLEITEVTYKDGVEVSSEVIRREVLEEAVDEIVRVGTKEVEDNTPTPNVNLLNQEFLSVINEERARKGVQKLTYNPQTQKGADIRAQEVATSKGYELAPEHKRPDGSDYTTAFDKSIRNKVKAENIGKLLDFHEIQDKADKENISYERAAAELFFDIYKNSPTHYRHMTTTKHTSISVGMGQSIYSALNVIVFSAN